MPIEEALAEALQDLTLEPLDGSGEVEASLIAGYSLSEVGASSCCSGCTQNWLCCCCSCGAGA
jgi:hypothetical protein